MTGGAPSRVAAGARVLFIAPADEALHAHTALRIRALERLGCAVEQLDPGARPGLLTRLRGAGRVRDRIRAALQSHHPDVVLVVGGEETLDLDVVGRLRGASDAVWVKWLTHHAYGVAFLQRVPAAYDVVAAATSDVAARIRGGGAARTLLLPLACDPSVHRPVGSSAEFRSNVAFVGTATPRREALLSEVVDQGLAIWGPGWQQTRLRDLVRGEVLSQDDYVRACAGASIALNIHDAAELVPSEGWGCNRRVFELAAIGVPQVVDARQDLARFFREGEEVLVYRDARSLGEQVREALRDPVAPVRMAAAARRRALAEHTYMHRMAALLDVVRGRA